MFIGRGCNCPNHRQVFCAGFVNNLSQTLLQGDLNSNQESCGSCGNNCTALEGTNNVVRATCTDGACALTCAIFTSNRDGNITKGCEKASATCAPSCDAQVCSSTFDNAEGVCQSAICTMGECLVGYADCEWSGRRWLRGEPTGASCKHILMLGRSYEDAGAHHIMHETLLMWPRCHHGILLRPMAGSPIVDINKACSYLAHQQRLDSYLMVPSCTGQPEQHTNMWIVQH
jgi:hypothetical protein